MNSIGAGSIGRAHRPPVGAKPRRAQVEPKVSLGVLAAVRALALPYARLGLKIDGVEFRHAERLLQALSDFREGRSRLILAFRHAYGDEPQALTLALARSLPREARRIGAASPGAVHALFVHGYEVPLWSGPLVRWILPRFGAMPVYHAKLDRRSMERIGRALREGAYPLALAPEGQSSYRSELLPRLEGGTARLAFWCALELRKLGRTERVEVLPLSLHYRFREKDIGKVEALVARVEADCGLASRRAAGGSGGSTATTLGERKIALAKRLASADERLIEQAEAYYFGAGRGSKDLDRDARLQRLMAEALRLGEAALGIEANGDLIDRVYRIRQEGWDRIYPEGAATKRSPLEKRLADRRAGEAWFAMRHMEFVDLCYYLGSGPLKTDNGAEPDFGGIVEAAYNEADLASRLSGGNFSHRPKSLRRTAILSVGSGLDLGARLGEYLADKKGAIEAATSDLEREYNTCVEEIVDERKR